MATRTPFCLLSGRRRARNMGAGSKATADAAVATGVAASTGLRPSVPPWSTGSHAAARFMRMVRHSRTHRGGARQINQPSRKDAPMSTEFCQTRVWPAIPLTSLRADEKALFEEIFLSSRVVKDSLCQERPAVLDLEFDEGSACGVDPMSVSWERVAEALPPAAERDEWQQKLALCAESDGGECDDLDELWGEALRRVMRRDPSIKGFEITVVYFPDANNFEAIHVLPDRTCRLDVEKWFAANKSDANPAGTDKATACGGGES